MKVNSINNNQQSFGRLRGINMVNDFDPLRNEKFFDVLSSFKDSKFFDEFNKQFDTRAVFSHEYSDLNDVYTTKLSLYYQDLKTNVGDLAKDTWSKVEVVMSSLREDESINMLAKKIRLLNSDNAKNWISEDDNYTYLNSYFTTLSNKTRVNRSNNKTALNDKLNQFLKDILLK